jgi:lysophospholipase L1-like esterase
VGRNLHHRETPRIDSKQPARGPLSLIEPLESRQLLSAALATAPSHNLAAPQPIASASPAFATHATAAPTPVPAVRPLTILPLGDSITWGFTTAGPLTGGYRARLYQDFAAHHQTVHFVGSVVDTYSKYLAGVHETHHEGHGGYQINQITANLDSLGTQTPVSSNNGGHWLDGTRAHPAVNPDIILLHAGTNDFIKGANATTAAARMDLLLQKLTRLRPKACLLVAGIIPMADRLENAQVQAYNKLLKTVLIPKYQKLGFKIQFVDQYKGMLDANGNVRVWHLSDGVHPDQVAYNLIGDTWSQAIQALQTTHPTWLKR